MEFISLGNPVIKVLKHCFLPKSTFYYKHKEGKQGRKSYAQMFDNEWNVIGDAFVLAEIKTLFEKPFVDYGCFKTYIHLRDRKHFKVSKHKVYKLMKENGLLRNKHQISSKKNKRNWVKDLIPNTSGPFSYLEFDIKYMWISGKKRNAQMLTIIDVESRTVLGQYIGYSIDKKHVIELFEKVFTTYPWPESVTVRSDNGSQFVAEMTQTYLKSKGITQEFTKPATPQQDAHIEAFHSIVERAVCQRFMFKNLIDLQNTLQEFIEFYNFERIHSGTGYTSPYLFLLQKEDENSSPSLKSILVFLTQKYENYLNKVSNI
jgi:putative transposase